MFSSRKGKKLYKTPSVKYNVCTNKKLTQVCLQNVKFLFFFFLNYSQKAAGNQKGSCRSRVSNPLKPLQNIKTIREKRKKETMSNIWHLVLSTGFPRAPLGIESKIHWQTQLLSTQEGSLSSSPADRGGSVQSDCGTQQALSRLGFWLQFTPHYHFQDIKEPTTGVLHLAVFNSSKMASSITYWETGGGHRAEILPEPLLHHLGVDDASQCFNNPPYPTPAAPCHPFLDSPSHQCLCLSGICQNSSLPPLLFTDPSFPSSFSSSVHILPSPQDPEATREEDKFPLGN